MLADPVIAVGVDLVYSAVTKLVGGMVCWRRGNVDLGIAGILLAGSFPGAMIGIGLLALLRAWGSDPNVLVMKALGVALVLASLAILLRAFLANRAPRPAPTFDRLTIPAGSIPGVLLGTRLSASSPERLLRPALAVVLLAVGLRLIA
ncbi:MAG: sulfite exporter TauE/SafE family protein [Candidatus Rokubacteria bacterium]|nr:sulfite exporter TauE/SafE family protein [Candidatus Rokubacteria bacterium]